MMAHKFMKMAACKTEKEFYSKYPTEDAFFAAYPHMKGNQTMKNGGAASAHEGSYWNGDSWVSTAGDSGTYANGVYYANGGNYSKMGGPTFPVGGSAPLFYAGGATQVYPFAMNPGPGYGPGMLEEYATEHMQNGGPIPGGDIVKPFAMWPGTGQGTGFLQDLPTEMKRGGRHKGGKKHLTPQQMQMMMAAMQQQQQAQNQQMSMPPQGAMMSPQDQQMMAMQQAQQQPMSPQDQQAMMMQQQGAGQQPMQPGMMKQGGIHIKKSHEGLFTKKAKAAGMGVQEYAHHVMAHSNNPTTRKQANFAIQAAKWKHEYGGTAMPDNPGFKALPPAVQQKIMDNMQTGGMVTDYRTVYAPGGEYAEGGNTNEYANMAIGQMSQMQHKLGELGKVLGQNTQVEPWVASKMTLANDYLNSVENYLEHNPEAQQHMMNGGQFPSFEQYSGNPFHPLTKFLRGGYYQPGGSTNVNNSTNMTDGSPNVSQAMQFNPATVQNNWNTNLYQPLDTTPNEVDMGRQAEQNRITNETGWQPIEESDMTQKEYLAPDSAANQYNNSQPIQTSKKKTRTRPYGTGFNNLLGTGMALASYVNDRNSQRSIDAYNRSQRGTSAMSPINQPGGRGDYDIAGNFRPNERIATAPGMFYPGYTGGMGSGYGPRTSQMGGMQIRDTFAQGGHYQPGQEMELSDAEIANLKRMGYKFDII
jgi:hypothetical protein